MVFSVLYFKKGEKQSLREGVIVGIVWFIISIVIDLLLFLPPSPMQMSFVDYMMDIGLTYLIILIIPIGIATLINKK
jgi:fumarate reductase subunit C